MHLSFLNLRYYCYIFYLFDESRYVSVDHLIYVYNACESTYQSVKIDLSKSVYIVLSDHWNNGNY